MSFLFHTPQVLTISVHEDVEVESVATQTDTVHVRKNSGTVDRMVCDNCCTRL